MESWLVLQILPMVSCFVLCQRTKKSSFPGYLSVDDLKWQHRGTWNQGLSAQGKTKQHTFLFCVHWDSATPGFSIRKTGHFWVLQSESPATWVWCRWFTIESFPCEGQKFSIIQRVERHSIGFAAMRIVEGKQFCKFFLKYVSSSSGFDWFDWVDRLISFLELFSHQVSQNPKWGTASRHRALFLGNAAMQQLGSETWYCFPPWLCCWTFGAILGRLFTPSTRCATTLGCKFCLLWQ